MITLRVRAGPHRRHACPVLVPVDLDPHQPVVLFQAPGRRPRACQWQGRRLCWLLTRLDAGESCDYQLTPVLQRRKPAARLRWQDAGTGLYHVALDGRPMGHYDANPERPFPGLRNLGPQQAVKELVVRGGRAVIGPSVHCSTRANVISSVAGPVFAQLETHGLWLGTRRARLLEERTVFTFHATPADVRLIDVTVTLRASFGPVSLAAGAGAGLLSLTTKKQESAGSSMSNSWAASGLDEVQGRRAAWIALGREQGMAMALFDHPENPGFPCAWRIDPDGAVIANPFTQAFSFDAAGSRFTLAAGEVVTFRHRLCFSSERRWREAVQEHWLNFACPPRVEVL